MSYKMYMIVKDDLKPLGYRYCVTGIEAFKGKKHYRPDNFIWTKLHEELDRRRSEAPCGVETYRNETR